MTTLLSRNVAQPGLQWRKGLLGAKPAWTESPSIDIIKKLSIKHLNLGDKDTFAVEFFAEGTCNKLYAITCSKGKFIFRVTLPVAPNVKTLSDIATLSFVRRKTTIPVPKVIAFDADLTNEFGFEWILMVHMDGRPLREKCMTSHGSKRDCLFNK
jgi:aminoglycoside phosphotransferase (APT) family kinase protein